jgi:hypothetical protein
MKLLERGVKTDQTLELCLGLLGPSFVKSGDEIKKVRMKTGHRMETVLNFVFHVVDSYWNSSNYG